MASMTCVHSLCMCMCRCSACWDSCWLGSICTQEGSTWLATWPLLHVFSRPRRPKGASWLAVEVVLQAYCTRVQCHTVCCKLMLCVCVFVYTSPESTRMTMCTGMLRLRSSASVHLCCLPAWLPFLVGKHVRWGSSTPVAAQLVHI